MAISDPQEATGGKRQDASQASDLQSSFLRRRLAAAAASATSSVSDCSSKTKLWKGENSATDSGEDSGIETSSDSDARDLIVDGDEDREDKKASSLMMNGGGDRAERVVDREAHGGEGKGEVHAGYMYRAAAPAHRRVKESPLSSDAIFKQVRVVEGG